MGRAPDRDAARGLGAEGRDAARLQRQDEGAAKPPRAAPTRSPTASGSFAAASRETMNMYFVEEGDGVTAVRRRREVDDARRSRPRRAQLGGITRVVLGHGHADHRGAAPGARRAGALPRGREGDAEGDGGGHYFDFERARPVRRLLLAAAPASLGRRPGQHRRHGRGGRRVAGFRVIHLPGPRARPDRAVARARRRRARQRLLLHARPQTGLHGQPRVPQGAFNQDTEQARASIRKLAAIEPERRLARPRRPLTGDVAAQLERAATTRPDGPARPPPRARPRRSAAPTTAYRSRRAATCSSCAAR